VGGPGPTQGQAGDEEGQEQPDDGQHDHQLDQGVT
jgi:hypothetical protein